MEESTKISDLAYKKIEQINDINRIIKSKAKYFKTLFIRYNAKHNEILDQEVSLIVNNLKQHGSKMTAKTSTIENQLQKAMESFNNIRETFDSEENVINVA